jgi:hypothetical protein
VKTRVRECILNDILDLIGKLAISGSKLPNEQRSLRNVQSLELLRRHAVQPILLTQ